MISTAEPLPFASKCFQWFREGNDEPDRAVSSECEKELGSILALRIRDAAQGRPLYEEWPADTPTLLWFWKEYGDGDVATHLQQRFTAHTKEILSLLATFTPTAWGLESGLSHKSDFRQDAYKSVSELISPEVVFQQLKSIYGESLDKAAFHSSRELPVEERIAHQFAFLHLKAQQASTPATPSETGDRADQASKTGPPAAGPDKADRV